MLYLSENPHGGDIYSRKIYLDYSANTAPYGTPQTVIDAVAAALPDLHHYPDPYCRELVESIAEHETVPPDYILCGNGAADLIYAYCRALKPARAVELAPGFAEYSLALSGLGCRVERYQLRKEDGFMVGEDLLAFLEETGPQLIFLCDPNNPTGRRIPRQILEEVLDYCQRSGARLFLDECFVDLCDDDRSMKDRLQDCSQLFILKAFTKSYGMAGLRLGYGLCSDRTLLAAMAKGSQPWNISSLAQCAGVAALKDRSFLKISRELIPVERSWLKSELERLGFWVCPSQANFLLFKGPEGLARAMEARGIALRDCSNYPGLGAGWYRIAVRLREQNRRLMSEMEQLLEKDGAWQKT